MNAFKVIQAFAIDCQGSEPGNMSDKALREVFQRRDEFGVVRTSDKPPATPFGIGNPYSRASLVNARSRDLSQSFKTPNPSPGYVRCSDRCTCWYPTEAEG